MRIIGQFINVLFFGLFFINPLYNQSDKIKNIQLFGSITNTQKSIFYKDEIIRVSFDELSFKTNNYYYSLDHYDFEWNKSNIFKNEVISGYDDIRISDHEKSFNTLQKFTRYSFSFPNEKFNIKLSGNFILSVMDSDENTIFKRRFIIVENLNPGVIDISRPKNLTKRNSFQNLKIKFRCINCFFDSRSEYKLVVIQNNNLNSYRSIEKTTLRTTNELIFDDILFEGDDEYYSFDTKNILGTNNEIRQSIPDNIYSTILYEDFQNLNYTYKPDKNGVFINNSLNDDNNLESDYTNVTFSLRTTSSENNNIYVIGGFNDYETSEKYMLQKAGNNLYTKTIKLKQGYYNYKYVKTENGNTQNLSNFWQTENNYSAFLYQKKPTDRFYKIVGYTTKNSDKIVN